MLEQFSAYILYGVITQGENYKEWNNYYMFNMNI
jgi:hypothetical protein